MIIPALDFETYSEAGLYFDYQARYFKPLIKNKSGISITGAAAYAEHQTTELISLSFDLLDGNGVQLWTPASSGPPRALFDYIARGGLIEAHNSLFEFFIWHYVCNARMDWPPLPIESLRCSQAKALANALPAKLSDLCDVLQPTEQKDKAGERLIQLLSVPKKMTKASHTLRRTPESDPELFGDMYAYNKSDVRSEMEISGMLPDVVETDLFLADQRINARGVAIDVPALDAFIRIFEQARDRFNNELKTITGGMIETSDEVGKILAFVQAYGIDTASVDKENVERLLEIPDLPPIVRRVLQIRQELGSKSVAKIYAIKYRLNADGRIRGLFKIYGAERTGRWAGRGPQPQNLPGAGPDSFKCENCQRVHGFADHCPFCGSLWAQEKQDEWRSNHAIDDAIRYPNLEDFEKLWPDVLKTISGSLRGLFIADDGKELISSDYSAIEAVVLAMGAGEQWRIEVFRTHGKIYEMSAAKISGVPFEVILAHKIETGKHHPLRKTIGKVAELASGYAGYIGAWKAFGAGEFMTDDEIKKAVLKWRDESPNIVEFWGGQWRKTPGKWHFTPELYGLEGAAVSAVLYPGHLYRYRGVSYIVENDVLYCNLLSGRRLAYHEPRLTKTLDPRKLEVWQLSYMGFNRDRLKGPYGWTRLKTYGGKLAENWTQATARDLLAFALLNVERCGYPVVLHVHDELTSEIDKGTGNITQYESIMKLLPPWAAGWPIRAAGGWIGRRFRK